MGRLGLILLLVLASAAPATAAISLVTSGSATAPNLGATTGNSSLTVTPAAATGDNNTVVVIVATKNTSQGMANPAVQDSGGSVYALRADVTANSTSSRVRVYSTNPGASKNSTWVQANVACCSFPSDIVVAVASYSGVYSLGNTATLATNSSTPATISVTIQDANNWVVAGFAGWGTANPSAASTGNMREHAVANGSIGGFLTDNTSGTPNTSVANAVNLTGPEWTAMAALELRTVQGFSAAEGHLCGISDKNSSSSWTFTAGFGNPLEAGHLGVLTLATDNRATSNGNTNDHQTVTDAAGNTWTKAREFTNAQGAAAAGVTVSIWYTKASSTLAAGANITVNFSGAITAKAASCEEFTMGDNLTVEAGGDVAATNTTSPGAITLSGLSNTSHLWIRATGREFPPGVWTGSGANFTQFWGTGTSSGSNTTNIDIRSEALIAAGTSLTTNPSAGTTTDWASTMVALSAVCNPVSNASYVAANAQNGQIIIYWPSGTNVVILQKASAFGSETPSAPGTATQAYSGSAGSFNQSVTNGTWYYKAFVQSGGCYSPGTAVSVAPATGTGTPVWSYATTAASMAPPALDPWSNIVVSGSNDNRVHSMGDANGTMSAGFTPFTTGGPIQARPTILPAGYSATGVNIGYVASQDGFVYAINTGTGAQVWQSPSLAANNMLQGGAAVWLQALKSLSVCGVTPDVVFVGTRNTGTTSANKVYALNGGNTTVTATAGGNCTSGSVAPGGILWTYTGGGTNPNMDIISSTPYPDFINNVVWVTSRGAGGTTQPSVWKLNATNGTLASGTATWNLGDVDSSPVPNADGSFIYVGTNAGTLQAIKVSTGGVSPYTPVTGTGAVVSLPWPLSYSPIGQATTIAHVNSASGTGITTTCAMSLGAVTAGNTAVVVVGMRTTTASVSAITDSAGSIYTYRTAVNGGTTARLEIWSATVASTAASNMVTVTLGSSLSVCAVGQYSGVGAVGLAATAQNTTAGPSISVATQDANNWVVAGFSIANGTVPTASANGNLRQTMSTGGGASNQSGGLCDNTRATPGSVGCTLGHTAVQWAAAALELRGVTTDTIIFTQGTYVQSVDFNGSTFMKNWTVQLTGTPTVSAPVDDGAGHLYIGGSDGKVHQVDIATGTDQKQAPTTAISGTFGDPTFNWDISSIHVGATDGHIYTLTVPF